MQAGSRIPAGGPKRPLELVECELKASDDPEAGRCSARRTPSRPGSSRASSKYSFSERPPRSSREAGVPMVGTSASSTEDYSNPNVFHLEQAAASSGGAGAALQAAGAKTDRVHLGRQPGRRGTCRNFITPVLESPARPHQRDLHPARPVGRRHPVRRSGGAAPIPMASSIAQSTDVVIKLVTGAPPGRLPGRRSPRPESPPRSIEKIGSSCRRRDQRRQLRGLTTTEQRDDQAVQRRRWTRYSEDTTLDEFSLNAWLTRALRRGSARRAPARSTPQSLLGGAERAPEVDLGVAPPFKLGNGDTYMALPTHPARDRAVPEGRGRRDRGEATASSSTSTTLVEQ